MSFATELPVCRASRCHAVAVAAVCLARLAAWALGVWLRLSLGERRGLALARAAGLFERSLQFPYPLVFFHKGPVLCAQLFLEVSHRLAETGHDRLQFGDTLLKAHPTLLTVRWALSGGWSRDLRELPGQNALSKYDHLGLVSTCRVEARDLTAGEVVAALVEQDAHRAVEEQVLALVAPGVFHLVRAGPRGRLVAERCLG